MQDSRSFREVASGICWLNFVAAPVVLFLEVISVAVPQSASRKLGLLAPDFARIMRENAKVGERTFVVTDDAVESRHRSKGLALSGVSGTTGRRSHQHVGNTWSVRVVQLGRSCDHKWKTAQCLAGTSATTWHLFVADDYQLDAGGPEFRVAFTVFCVPCATAGVPEDDGVRRRLIGAELFEGSDLCLSERRAKWFVWWTYTVNFKNLEEGNGRVMYVARALEPVRPFLGTTLQVHDDRFNRSPSVREIGLLTLSWHVAECRGTQRMQLTPPKLARRSPGTVVSLR